MRPGLRAIAIKNSNWLGMPHVSLPLRDVGVWLLAGRMAATDAAPSQHNRGHSRNRWSW